ncbi:glucose-6-phosphate isomerase [Sedimentibacter sp. zth1]|uniref:glucose-6-phosphate isomerase n=1 Tax=Sedimentibacter sp. zth1 TaxID=2816908 RepID=UPI001A9362D3|nr:glucose-6-phosphate isomerase [Sedimentibacter sp. zth1]QSX05292.1 glucose-6-phosphate isomerase [Sedimentibacter sp. zth1]
MIKVSTNAIKGLVLEKELDDFNNLAFESQKKVFAKSGEGNEFLGWVDLYSRYDKEEFSRIKETAERIKHDSNVVIVIGIGGSYLGAKAAIHAIKGDYFNDFNVDCPKIYFSGCNLSGESYIYYTSLIQNHDVSLIVISKSGTTLEPAIGFRILKDAMYDKYGETASKRIYTITDKSKGALKKLSDDKNFESFVVPDDIGGRYSVFTPVGLLPMAVVGIDIDKFYMGLRSAGVEYSTPGLENPCVQYAIARYCLYQKGKDIEILLNYNPRLNCISEWWKQLFAESEGKDGKGLFPASMSLTTDLHSIGQMIQDGNKIFFETTVYDESKLQDVVIPNDDKNLDGLNYIAGKTLQYINENAYMGTSAAHTSGGVPNLEIRLPYIDEYYLGKLLYFFMMSCAISGYMLGVNPFNQPGVEEYKLNIYRLLGRK